MMRPLVIIGAGGHGRDVLDVVHAANAADPRFEVLGFLDDGPDARAPSGTPLLGPIATLAALRAGYLIGIGAPRARRRIHEFAASLGLEAATAIHPSVTVGADVRLEPGVVLMAGVRLTNNIRLGRHTHVNVNASISHDCQVGDYVTLSPQVGLSGNVVLEDDVTLGIGAVVTPGVRVGAASVIGAGAVVIDDIPPGMTAVGVPARPR